MSDNQESMFEKIYNFRDVGATVNAHSRTRVVGEKLFYRSGRLDEATSEDRRRLVQEYGIKTIIDLRTKSEHVRQSERRRNMDRPSYSEAVSGEIGIPGVETRRINFISRGFEMNVLKQLSWWDIISFLFLMLFRFRIKAIRIIGTQVLCHRGLVGLSFDSLEHCSEGIRETLEILSDPSAYPLILHCTQGKDRTGLITILVLLLLGDISVDAIKMDYTLSWEGLAPIRDEMLLELNEVGLDKQYAMTPEGLVLKVKSFLEERYGGVEGYLDRIGFGEDRKERLVGILSRR